MDTVLVFGDPLNRRIGALGAHEPGECRVLLVESEVLLRPTRHVQRLHLVVTAMRRFAGELRQAGFGSASTLARSWTGCPTRTSTPRSG